MIFPLITILVLICSFPWKPIDLFLLLKFLNEIFSSFVHNSNNNLITFSYFYIVADKSNTCYISVSVAVTGLGNSCRINRVMLRYFVHQRV